MAFERNTTIQKHLHILLHLITQDYVVKVKNGCRCQMADGHLGQAQMAEAHHISHLGLGSNF